VEPQTFFAPSLAEAYEQVRAALGEDALILSTQTSPRLGGSALVEVVAAPPAGPGLRPLAAEDLAAHQLVREIAETAATRPEIGTPGPVAAAAQSTEALLAAIAERTRSIETSVRWLTSRRAAAVVAEGPHGLREVHDRLVEHGMLPRLLEPLLQRLEGQLRADVSTREVLRVAERTLAALLPAVPRLELGIPGQVVFLVGPRSAEKTSIALRLAREAAPRRGVIASTDVDRAGAPQALRAAAAAAGIEARLCYAPSDLRALVAEESTGAVVVDAAGHDGTRSDRMLELRSYLQVPVRRTTLLALPATFGALEAERAVAAYAPFGLDGLVLSGVDEAVAFGGVLSAALSSGIGVAYAAPAEGDTLALGDNHALALAALVGRWPAAAAPRREEARAAR
jgi:flagellar biosynthesis protein FlhF